ncbi:MAG: DUF1573 domain-containing protein, partial [Planctomycetota bacterium]
MRQSSSRHWGAAFVLVVVGVFLTGPTATAQQPSGETGRVDGPRIRLDSVEYDWGKVMHGEIVTHVYKVVNEGTAPLRINNVRPSCGCSASNWTKTEIPPGESGTIELSVNTAKLQGGVTKKEATVFTNDRLAADLKVFIGGEILTIAKPTPERVSIVGLASETKSATLDLVRGTDQTFEVLSVASRYSQVAVERTETVESGKHYRLHLAVSPALPGTKPDSLDIRVRAGNGTEHHLAVPVSVEHQPRIQLNPAAGIVFRRDETDKLLAPGAEPLVKEVLLESSRPDIRFTVESVEIEGPASGVFATSVETLAEGLRYRILVQVTKYSEQRFARGKLAIRTS